MVATTTRTRPLQATLLCYTSLLLLCAVASSTTFITRRLIVAPNRRIASTRQSVILQPRGGASLEIHDDEDEDDEEEEESSDEEEQEEESLVMDEDDVESEEDDDDPLSSVISSEPISVTFKTNLGSSVVDTSLELLVSRARTIESVKATLARMLPGRPPVESIRILYAGTVLQNEQLMDELIDEDDEEEDEEEDESSGGLTLVLDMVPPVDPKFATELVLKDLSTAELVDAYSSNAAVMYHNAQDLMSSTTTTQEDRGPLSIHLRQQAARIRDQLVADVNDELLSAPPPSAVQATAVTLERRGQRVRLATAGGVHGNLKRSLQRNLNVNWPESIRNFLLFLFFGFFGGRNVVSRNLLLMCAPLSFVLQARAVKIYLKQAFYTCSNPPSIFLSLLPAPQQAMLSFDMAKAYQELYGTKALLAAEEETEDDDELEEEEESESSDEEEDDDEEYDSDDE